MKAAKITFANGDFFTTNINGTEEQIKQYYAVGRWFNVGLGPDDNMQQIARCELIPSVLLFHETQESDLYVGKRVCYMDLNGEFSKLGTITDILETKPCKTYLLDTAIGGYLASELKIYKQL